MLDIVAEVNRMVQNGNTSALFSPVNEYDWVSSDQVTFKHTLPPFSVLVDSTRVSNKISFFRFLLEKIH